MNNCCSYKNPDVLLKTKNFGKICKYHKRAGQEYETNDIVKDFCFEAFYITYPYCLALLYNAKFSRNSIELSCPQKEGLVLKVSRKRCWSLPVAIFFKFLKWFSQRVSFPLDIEDWHIKLKVVENKGACPKRYEPGKTYQFNIGRLEELCPASFFQLYPFISEQNTPPLMVEMKRILRGKKMPRLLSRGRFTLSGKNNLEIHCPDHEGMSYIFTSEVEDSRCYSHPV